jgi:diguanylate cyclase (GGDEF)-like protein
VSVIGSFPGSRRSGTPTTARRAGRSVTQRLATVLAPGTTKIKPGAAKRAQHAGRGRATTAPGAPPRRDITPSFTTAPAAAIEHFIKVIPTAIWIALGVLAALAVIAGAASVRWGRRAHRQSVVVEAVTAAALTDPLTAVLNRRGFTDAFKRELDRAWRYGRPLALIFVDIRGLKGVNDTQGHLAGDRLLKEVASTLEHSARAHDLVGRIGGDEFAILLTEQSAEGVKALVTRLRSQIPDRRAALGVGNHWDITVGIAIFPEDGQTVEDLFEAADRRLYRQRGIQIR